MNRLQDRAYKNYIIKHELLYRGDEGEDKLVVLKGLQDEIIRKAYEIVHFGPKKTMELLTREYWIESMEQRLNKFIQNC